MECLRFDYFKDEYYTEEFSNALIDQDKQRETGRRQNYPQDVIIKQIIEEFSQATKLSEVSERIEFVQLFIPLSGPSNKKVLPLIQSARELWVALQSRRDLGDDTYESAQSHAIQPCQLQPSLPQYRTCGKRLPRSDFQYVAYNPAKLLSKGAKYGSHAPVRCHCHFRMA